ncbi:hypothetical protein LNAOJCKE_3492 [Methylorubrum aminovorans]|uniref:Uncharacterized protein n=1 Tax=Methylorubrum aminovorans TaxID=269069 RepID=A0ABQ4UGL2_9HYPH|nr:hypothetical protein CLZ_00910 [Methylobacterium sp. CLZ]QIJ82444.1 hypothetical protein GU700_00910 [Methylobacterium sp. NI91]GJE66274.1 hypothetical protein LNAOJCKE_3492 [Methylorubrum aminovorans]
MPRHASYRIIERPDGRFDIAVTLAGGGTHVREGLVNPVDVQTALAMLRDLMAACGAVLVEAEALSLAAE